MLSSSKSSVLLMAISLAVVAQPGIAGPLEDGAIAYAQGNYAGAIQILRPLAEDPVSKDFQDASKARDTTAKSMTSAEVKVAEAAVHQCLVGHYKNCD